jgi:putative tryptophan/tyrosine transport system substrate-binding protein
MKILLKVLVVLTALFSFTVLADQTGTPKIGIVIPLEHPAMHEIVNGFETTLQKQYGKPIDFKVENAQHDSNLERAIIAQMRDTGYTMIVPIGVAATEMSVSMVKQQPIVSLASDFSDADRKKLNPCNITAVHDEISPAQELKFIRAVYPQLKNIVLVHSADDKVFPQVKETQAAAEQYGFNFKHVMVQTLPDMYSVAQSIPADTQAIFVLKDNLIVSGIDTLAKLAAQRHIPLITSDQGSVQTGAGFALGVHEKQIGIEGGKLAAQVLAGKNICSLPIVDMTNLSVFVNQKALLASGQNLDPINAAAKQLHYTVELY